MLTIDLTRLQKKDSGKHEQKQHNYNNNKDKMSKNKVLMSKNTNRLAWPFKSNLCISLIKGNSISLEQSITKQNPISLITKHIHSSLTFPIIIFHLQKVQLRLNIHLNSLKHKHKTRHSSKLLTLAHISSILQVTPLHILLLKKQIQLLIKVEQSSPGINNGNFSCIVGPIMIPNKYTNQLQLPKPRTIHLHESRVAEDGRRDFVVEQL